MRNPIERLSTTPDHHDSKVNGLAMTGSYAPVHEGHFDTMRSAERCLLATGDSVGASVFAPNSNSYVLKKISDERGTWNFNRRVYEFLSRDSRTKIPSYVDNITGTEPPEKSISEPVIDTVSNKLGIAACNLVLVAGMDQVKSIEPHPETNKAICILRPGYESTLQDISKEKWFLEAVDSKRLILASGENTDVDISSTEIRRRLDGITGD